MLLKLSISDPTLRAQGTTRLRLDWAQGVGARTGTWTVEDDPQQVWPRVGFARQGTFEWKTWGVMWICTTDPQQPVLIVWDAPTGGTDAGHPSGVARIYAPRDAALKDG